MILDEFLSTWGEVRLGDIALERIHHRHEGWEEYEARWLPGTCPRENYSVHLTWLVSTHRLPEFGYERIRELIEDGAEPEKRHLYSTEPGKHFSEIRPYEREPAKGGTHARSMF